MGLLSRLFGTSDGNGQRDGQAEELAAHATGLPPALLDAGLLAGGSPGRRQRQLASPRAVVMESLGGKVLHAWVQNRHQTLYPLTVNFRMLEPPQAALLAQVMAVVLLADPTPPDAARIEAATSWLGTVGAEPAVQAALRAALETPRPLSRMLHEVQQSDMAPYAYVVALAAGPSHDPAGQLFLDYLAARLDLPTEVIRSANRRYRR